MPLLLGVLSREYGFSDGELGALGSEYSVGATLVALTSVVWMCGLFLRLPAVLFLLLGLGALASIAFVRRYPLALATFFLAGIGLGGVYLLMIALLSRTESPNRSYGWQWGIGSLPGAHCSLYAIPSFITLTGGVRPVFELIVAANVIMAFVAIFLPDRLEPAPNAVGPGRLVGFPAAVRANVWIALVWSMRLFIWASPVDGHSSEESQPKPASRRSTPGPYLRSVPPHRVSWPSWPAGLAISGHGAPR